MLRSQNTRRRSVRPFECRPYDRLRSVAFLHIPKSAGCALTAGLREALTPKHFVTGFDRSLFGGFEAFASLHEEIRDIIYLDPRTVPTQADLICGHFAFSTLVASSDEPQVVTFLREPYSRLLSHWLFWRSHSDEQLAPWGEWGNLVKKSREPLAHFLSCPQLAAHIDNIAVRMLLWPHPLVPFDSFIDTHNDEELVSAALIKLGQSAYTDIIENSGIDVRLQSWLGYKFSYVRVNETSPMPFEQRTPLSRELTTEALALLDRHTRLDACLWEALAAQRIAPSSVEEVRHHTTLKSTARYADLAMGIGRTCDTDKSKEQSVASVHTIEGRNR